MTAQIIRGEEVNRPEPDALTSTLLDHATVVTLGDGKFGKRNNGGMWPSYNCLDLLTPTAMCPDPMVGTKTFKRAEWQTAFEFAVYGGTECSAVGLDTADQSSETQRVFEASQAKGVEQALLYTRFSDVPDVPGSDDPLTPSYASWELPEDITPAGGVPLAAALALLEGHAAANYVGVPTLHLPRAAVLMASSFGLVVEKDGKFFTKTGAKIAAGGGYDDPTMLATGQWDLYATGEVYVEMSDKIEQQVYVIPGDGSGTGSDQNGLADNTVIAFAERMFRVAIDCYAAKVTATVWGP